MTQSKKYACGHLLFICIMQTVFFVPDDKDLCGLNVVYTIAIYYAT